MNFVKTNNPSEENMHWRNCIEKTMPFVSAMRRGKYYFVTLDLFPTICDLNELGIKLVEKEINGEVNAVESQRTRNHGIHCHAYKVRSICSQVLPERVDSFCNKLFEISTDPQNIDEDKILNKCFM
jgi:hypothetical protein